MKTCSSESYKSCQHAALSSSAYIMCKYDGYCEYQLPKEEIRFDKYYAGNPFVYRGETTNYELKKQDSWNEFLEWLDNRESSLHYGSEFYLKQDALYDSSKLGLLIEYIKEKIPDNYLNSTVYKKHFDDKYCITTWDDLSVENLERIIKEGI